MADTLTEQKERRAWPRLSTVDHLEIASGKVRPGHPAQIVDMSAGGALIETACRLMPGMRVELQVGEPVMVGRAKGRVLRCHVFLLDRDRIRYRGALAFEEELQLHGNVRPTGSRCPRDDGIPGVTAGWEFDTRANEPVS